MIADAPQPTRRSSKTDQAKPSSGLRLPEDRAFDVATINSRLARMAERAGPRRPRRPSDA